MGDEHIHPGAFTNTSYLIDPQYALFADYLHSPDVYQCPGRSHHRRARRRAGAAPRP